MFRNIISIGLDTPPPYKEPVETNIPKTMAVHTRHRGCINVNKPKSLLGCVQEQTPD